MQLSFALKNVANQVEFKQCKCDLRWLLLAATAAAAAVLHLTSIRHVGCALI